MKPNLLGSRSLYSQVQLIFEPGKSLCWLQSVKYSAAIQTWYVGSRVPMATQSSQHTCMHQQLVALCDQKP